MPLRCWEPVEGAQLSFFMCMFKGEQKRIWCEWRLGSITEVCLSVAVLLRRPFVMLDAFVDVRAENYKDIKAAAPGSPLEQHRAEAPLCRGQQEDVGWFTVGINLLETNPGALKAADRS